VIAAQFKDPENARIIFFAAGGLLVLAIVLVVATILWWRSSGVEPTALAPLEVMSTRTWWNSDDEARREQVESVRAQLDLRAGPPEAGLVVERAGDISGVSVLSRSRGDDYVDDDVLDERADAAPASAPAARGSEEAALARLARFDAGDAPAPVAPAAPAPAARPGLFDQFEEDPFDDWVPAPEPEPPARQAKGSARPEASTSGDVNGDIWGGSAEPRRSIDPLLNDGDFW
jgi:hypothetical protein